VDYPAPSTADPSIRKIYIAKVAAAETRTLALGGVAAKVTVVTLDKGITKAEPLRSDPGFIRGTIVYAQSELLPLAEAVIADPLCGGDSEIELDGLYSGLEPGRWLIVSGERADVTGVTGIPATELLMLSSVRHGTAEVQPKSAAKAKPTPAAISVVGGSSGGPAVDPLPAEPVPGEKTHTYIKIASGLAYCYRRDNVKIYANVVHATHGESVSESLGNGDAARPFLQFVLKQGPLTQVSAATATGIQSTLQVLVNDVIWTETDSFAGINPYDRKFVTKTADDASTTVIFGDGVRGARTPTGLDNLRARYRKGIGASGNLIAQQISQLGDRPLGVQAVINPLASTGGADPETRDQARRNAPLATTALDRLVSTQDYADFAHTFAGISKASSVELPGIRGQLVHVTIAGLDDIPIAESSDLFRNLRLAMIRFGDPLQPLQVAVRERILLVMSANVKVAQGYLWEKVEPVVRQAVLDALGFDHRDLGQYAFLSEAITAMQAVEGVEYVDVDSFGGVFGLKADGTRLSPAEIAAQVAKISQSKPLDRVPAHLARYTGGVLLPAQVAYFAADQKPTLVLNEVKS
ncbi:MAG: putative baseplate assembly protein, partial [Candidatus Solibacter sp.]